MVCSRSTSQIAHHLRSILLPIGLRKRASVRRNVGGRQGRRCLLHPLHAETVSIASLELQGGVHDSLCHHLVGFHLTCSKMRSDCQQPVASPRSARSRATIHDSERRQPTDFLIPPVNCLSFDRTACSPGSDGWDAFRAAIHAVKSCVDNGFDT